MMPIDLNFLVVDDSFSIRKAVKTSLKKFGFEGKMYESDSALRARDFLLLPENFEKVDFIICDYEMPGATGIFLLEFVRNSEVYRTVPFLILSAVNNKGMILEAITKGVTSYMLKPWEDDAFKAKLEASWIKRRNS